MHPGVTPEFQLRMALTLCKGNVWNGADAAAEDRGAGSGERAAGARGPCDGLSVHECVLPRLAEPARGAGGRARRLRQIAK